VCSSINARKYGTHCQPRGLAARRYDVLGSIGETRERLQRVSYGLLHRVVGGSAESAAGRDLGFIAGEADLIDDEASL